MSCRERAALLVRAREAYQRDDIPEVKRLLIELFGTALKDVDRFISVVVAPSNKPERSS